MAGIQDCIENIKKAAGEGTLTDADAGKILKQVYKIVEEKKAAGDLTDLDKAVLKQAAQVANDLKVEALIQKRSAAINVLRRNEALQNMSQYKNSYVALRALLGGVSSLYKGARLSIDARQKAISGMYQRGLLNDMEKAGLIPLFNSGEHDRLIARELWELSSPDGKPGVTKSASALQMAKIVHKWQRVGVDRLNRAGAWIRDLPGYIVRQSHDQSKIRDAGFKQWKQDVVGKLDEYTFRDVVDREKFLRSVYEGLATGEHFKHADSVDLNEAFGSSPSVAKSVSRERVLHFKSADDWMDYHQKYGRGELREAVYHGLERDGMTLGLMEVLGTNPENMFRRLRQDAVKDVRAKAADGDSEALKTVKLLEDERLDHIFAELTGTTRNPVNVTVAKVAASVRAVQSMSKLGASTLSSLGDIAAFGSELRYQGKGFFESYLAGFQNLLRGRGTTEQREIARLVGVGSESMIGDALSRFSADDAPPGMISKAVHNYFRFNLQHWWNDSFLNGAAMMMSNDLAENAHLKFGQLRNDLQRTLNLYGIDEHDWDMVKHAVHDGETGAKYVTLDRIQQLQASDLASYHAAKNGPGKFSERAALRLRDELQTKLGAYFSDRAYHAVPTPGANERAFLIRGTQPGTNLGEAVRFVMQFKAFPTSYLSKLWSRETMGRVEGGTSHVGLAGFAEGLRNGKGSVWHMAELIATTTVMGYLSMVAKDVAKGREPRDPNSRDTWQAAMLQGGGLGIYGDFIFGQFNRFGRSALASLAGPTLGQFDDVMDLYSKWKAGDDAAAQAVRWVVSNTPGANLFYTKAALDYLILYQLQERMSPGYLRRMEKRLQEEQKQGFIVPPSTQISYGGKHNRIYGD